MTTTDKQGIFDFISDSYFITFFNLENVDANKV